MESNFGPDSFDNIQSKIMNYSKDELREILKHSIPNRFQDISPTDFEDIIAAIFKEIGYQVEQTSYSGDYGADVIATKEDERIAIQVKRYGKKNKVGVHDVNQIIGAKDYYKCNSALIITTSDYTKAALKLIRETGIDKWNWEGLVEKINDNIFDGKSVYEYYPDTVSMSNDNQLRFKFVKVRYNMEMKGGGIYTLIDSEIINEGGNVQVDLKYPIIITTEGKQIEASYWYEGYFNGGTIYAGASVECLFMFRKEQLGKVSEGDKIIYNVFQDDNCDVYQSIVGKLNVVQNKPLNVVQNKPQGSCYIATMCYGRESMEYAELTYFRDNLLLTNRYGVVFVEKYYQYGGFLLKHLKKNGFYVFLSKVLIKTFLPIIILLNRLIYIRGLIC